MVVAEGVPRRGGRQPARSPLGGLLGFLLLLGLTPRPGAATTHWVVTEDGKIQQQVREGLLASL